MSEMPKPKKTTKKTTKKVAKKKTNKSEGYCRIYHQVKLTRSAAEVAKARMQDENLTMSQLVIKLLTED